jgi:ribosomal protein S18 acetylase RimI-like enzyme
MATARPARSDELTSWFEDWGARLDAWYRPLGAAGMARLRHSRWSTQPLTQLAVLEESGARVGHVATAVLAPETSGGSRAALVLDLVVELAHRRQGHGQSLLEHARVWARAHADTFGAAVWSTDPGVTALMAGLTLRSQRRYLPLVDPASMSVSLGPVGIDRDGTPLVARELTPAEFDGWRAREMAGYVADIVNSGSLTEAEALARGESQIAELLPRGLDTPGHVFRVLVAGSTPVADVWLTDSFAPSVSFVYSVATSEKFRGRGYGRAIMKVAAACAQVAGSEYLGLNVFGHNDVAIRLYESLGYQLVEESRYDDFERWYPPAATGAEDP